MFSLRRLFYIGLLLFLLHRYLGFPSTSYVFKVKTVKNVGVAYSGAFYHSSSLRKEFEKIYPDYVLNENDFPWIPCSTGGLQGSVTLLYASLTEFLALYHAEMETSGNSGRHYMNISVTVLQGQLTESTHQSTPVIVTLSKGENKVFRMGTSSTIKLSQGTSMLIYGRGFLPLTMGYWLSDSLFSNHDILLVVTTIWLYLKAIVMCNALMWQWMCDMCAHLWKTSSNGFMYLYESAYYQLLHLPVVFSRLVHWLAEIINEAWEQLVAD